MRSLSWSKVVLDNFPAFSNALQKNFAIFYVIKFYLKLQGNNFFLSSFLFFSFLFVLLLEHYLPTNCEGSKLARRVPECVCECVHVYLHTHTHTWQWYLMCASRSGKCFQVVFNRKFARHGAPKKSGRKQKMKRKQATKCKKRCKQILVRLRKWNWQLLWAVSTPFTLPAPFLTLLLCVSLSLLSTFCLLKWI